MRGSFLSTGADIVRVLLQRVTSARVTVDGAVVGEIGRGVVLLTGFGRDDDGMIVARAASKIFNLRIFPDGQDRLQYSLADTVGDVLVVPQFTLYANTRRGRRPDFTEAMNPGDASRYFDDFVSALRTIGVTRVETGRFGAAMAVSLVNDGPFTLSLDF